ncbi:hypothetical protein Q4E93_19660 [Flavitalea sp. BT771]|uniref:hypothetical protein n=1 Tax=Flavitalea sp. BT771 TaxID=3063329 RepID=UPI0026E1CED8|nr:hypothetical protein [Flavitalea sp. BT771]MDO6432834.1 hypothetical protein [Flavitalea sp. BT771]MDV6221890.1 hypothetical protein [Flavitalea sp. BT771]
MKCFTTTTGIAVLAGVLCMAVSGSAKAQYPTSCTGVGSRANSNGQANNCPNVSATPYASNFTGTSYATVPVTAKTGNFQLTYTGANASLTPYAITKVWLTTTGSTVQSVAFGPAGVPTVSGGNTLVNYCFYGSNLPSAGTLSLQLTNPQTGVVWGICSYDASCNSNCVVVANPTTLPVTFSWFKITEAEGSTVRLAWETAQEQNNKGFDIERQEKDGSFVTIGFVPSANTGGNSSNKTDYIFVDNNIPSGEEVRYRLRQIDLDGKYDYSSIATALVNGVSRLPLIYAAGRQVIISFPSPAPARRYDVLVHDTQGKLIRRLQVPGTGSTTIDGLSAGHLYLITLNDVQGARKAVRPVFVD